MRQKDENAFWSKIEYLLSREDLRMSGHVLSKNDRRRVANAYVMLAILFLDISDVLDTLNESSARRGLRRSHGHANIAKALIAWAHTDVDIFIDQQKCALQLLRHLPDGRCSRCQFEKLARDFGYDRSLPCNRLFNRLLWDVSKNRSILAFSSVSNLVQFMSRLTLRDVDWIEEENLNSYKEFEKSLREQKSVLKVGEFDSDDEVTYLVAEMRDIISGWLQDFSMENVEGQHGYGATAQVKRSRGTAEKYRHIEIDRDIALVARTMDWTPLPWVWAGLSEKIEAAIEKPRQEVTRSTPIVRVQLVPKGANKKRVVSMEDTTNQFFQKNLQDRLRVHFDTHPEMKITLENQDVSRRLARKSSFDRLYGTADLSNASDSVTWSLVKEVFQDTPVWPTMRRLRTSLAQLPDGTVIQMEKAFPMGSALCFPVECIIFSSIIAAANRHLGINANYRVYGDDMIIHRDTWDLAIHYLKLLCFQVNETKSFPPAAPFKEACGMEAWYGVDVSPLRISRKWDIVDLDKGKWSKPNRRNNRHKGHDRIPGPSRSTMITSLYDLGNECYDWSYKRLRSYIIQIARKNYSAILFCRNRRYGFISNAVELNPDLKLIAEYNGPKTENSTPTYWYYSVIGVDSKVAAGDDDSRYSKLLETYSTSKRTQLLDPSDLIEAKCGAARTSVRRVRVPLQFVEATDEQLQTV